MVGKHMKEEYKGSVSLRYKCFLSFLGKNDIWTLGEDLIIPIDIVKLKMKQGSTVEEFDVTYIDLTTMTVRKNDRGDLLNHIKRVILSNQEAKKLQIFKSV